MDCGSAPLCGVLVLESGYGQGKYSHSAPCVHGLWPETGSFGSSECLAPRDSASPDSLASCYDDLGFMTHEWTKHGVCAGVRDSTQFFNQICKLSAAPLATLSPLHDNQASLETMASGLKAAGFPVYYVDSSSNSQIYLAACGNAEGQWSLSDPEAFSSACGQ